MTEPLLHVDNLSCGFRTEGGYQRVVDRVSFAVAPGETLGVVGESGCGKTVTALTVMGLLPRPAGVVESGRIVLAGHDLAGFTPEQMRDVRGRRIGMIFQEPMTALNPVHTVGRQLLESLRLYEPRATRAALDRRALELLEQVGIPAPVQRPAFLAVPALPPPAPGPDILARADGPRTGIAPDRRIAAIVQRVVGHATAADVAPDIRLRPVRQRVELDQPVRGVEFAGRKLRPRDRLLAAQTGQPGIAIAQRLLQRNDLADMAAALAQPHAFVKAVGAVIGHVTRHGSVVRPKHLDLAAVAVLGPLQELQRLARQAPRVQREHGDRQAGGPDRVGEHHVFRAQAACHRRARKLRRNGREPGHQVIGGVRCGRGHEGCASLH